jgi:tetratricopeptide (TPR) repeat protein/predicted Ser/Thr protein kinase
MSCPTDEDLAQFASGATSVAVADHVAACSACATVVEVVRASDRQDATSKVEPLAVVDENPRPGDVIARYVILRALGRGGMGMVFLAYDPVLDRTVALKLMRADRSTPELAARLEREAQSLARIAHPNVVRVFDAGTWSRRVYMAMEHVEGETLRVWLDSATRSRADILRVFADVARGLEATHAAGFVHRDVKPDNILVGNDGVARLADFGLVGWDRPSAAREEAVSEPATAKASLTDLGHVLGTPGYLAPEQQRGDTTVAATDQFGYCTSLWEALFGSRPVAGQTRRTDSAVPAWLQDVVCRGLRVEPSDRWPSMGALLAALERDPIGARRRRAQRAALVTTIVTLGGLTVYGLSRDRAAADVRCQQMEDKLIGVWDTERAAHARRAFLATGRHGVSITFDRVAQQLDAYTRDWVNTRVDACEATHVRGDQSAALMDLRMACLDRRLQDVRALVDTFSTGATAEVVDSSVTAVAKLTPLDACADVAALQALVPPPADPVTRARVDIVRRMLADAAAAEETGQYARGLGIATSAAEAARQVGHAPVLAEALHRLASLQERSGDASAARTMLERALLAAADAHDDRRSALIWADLIYVVGASLGRPADAMSLRSAAEASARRSGSNAGIEAKLSSSLAVTAYSAGNYDEARAHGARALGLLEQARGAEHLDLAPLLTMLGIVDYSRGALAEARAFHERALEIFERSLGPDHPKVAATLTNLGLVFQVQDQLDDSRRAHERALAIFERSLGADHPSVASSLTNLGLVLLSQGRGKEASAMHERALAIREQTLAAEHPDIAVSLSNLGGIHQAAGRYREALQLHERALAMREKVLGAAHHEVGVSLTNLGDAKLELRDARSARAHYARALAVFEKALGHDHPHVAYALTGLAETALALGQPTEARDAAQRGFAIRERARVSAAELGTSLFVLARTLWAIGSERRRALDLARQAAERFAAAGAGAREQLADVNAWLDAR